MAFTAAVEWDVRTTGDDANGGGFAVGSGGTDYSQQDSPQVTYTDLVIDGTTNTKCTSSTYPFTSAHVGNIINITSGTGFTVQRVQVISVSSAVATCDKSLGTLGSTGGQGKLGGALLTVAQALSLSVASNKIHIKAGTYAISSVLTISTGSDIEGYNTSHNDGGTKPLITTATNSTNIFSVGTTTRIKNLSLSNTAATRGSGIICGSNAVVVHVYDCVFDGFSVAIPTGSFPAFDFALIDHCEIKNCTATGSSGTITGNSSLALFYNYIHDNAAYGLYINGAGPHTLVGNIVESNSYGAIFLSSSGPRYIISGNVFALNANDGLKFSYTAYGLDVVNNIFYGNGGYGVNGNAPKTHAIRNNAFGGNVTANRNSFPVGVNDVTLSADPFTDSSNGDFSLNSTAGGGAACKNAGFQWGS